MIRTLLLLLLFSTYTTSYYKKYQVIDEIIGLNCIGEITLQCLGNNTQPCVKPIRFVNCLRKERCINLKSFEQQGTRSWRGYLVECMEKCRRENPCSEAVMRLVPSAITQCKNDVFLPCLHHVARTGNNCNLSCRCKVMHESVHNT